MANLKITKRAVAGLTSGPKDELWWDISLRGFGVKVTRGGSKTFLIQYRMGGRGALTRRYTIGKLDSPWDVASARDEAERLLRMVATGLDPQIIERQRKSDEIDLIFQKYSERFLADFGQKYWRPRTFQSRAADLRRWANPVLKAKPLPSITRRDITAVLDSLPKHSPALPRNVFAVLRKMFTWAKQRGDIEKSPCEGVKPPPAVKARDRVLKDDELMLVAALSDTLGNPFGPFVRMLLVTGQRRDEVAGMRWEELDQTTFEWLLPKARSKNHNAHLMPLNDIAVRGLDELAGGPRWPLSGYVFSTTGVTPISGFSRMKRRLDAVVDRAVQGNSLMPWRLHDLRRTMATNLQRLGVRFEVTEALLNHVSGARSGIAGVYQRHDWHAEKRDAVTLWNDQLIAMLNQFADQSANKSN